MATTTTPSGLVVTKYLSDYFEEYIRGNAFSAYTGEGSNNPIVIKNGRQTVNIPLVGKVGGSGVSGSATLEGNEQTLSQYAYTLTPTYHRQAIKLNAEEREKPAIDQMMAARDGLMSWSLEKVRDAIIEAMGSVNDGTNLRTYNSTAAAYNTSADTWVGNNTDRVLFGAATSNYSAGDFSASLANVDSTADKLTGDIVRLARKIARLANPVVRPIRTSNGIETYVMFVGSNSFLHLQADLETLHSNAGTRGEGNPLFRPGDLIWDNVIVREVPEISTLLSDSVHFATAGASSSKVEPAFLCGAQALGYGLGQKPRIIVDSKADYEFQPGVAVELKYDIDKLVYNDKDHGMVSVYCSGVA